MSVDAVARHRCVMLRSLSLDIIQRYISSTCAKYLQQFNSLVHLQIYQDPQYHERKDLASRNPVARYLNERLGNPSLIVLAGVHLNGWTIGKSDWTVF